MSYDSDVAAATSGRGGEVEWDKIIKLCDRIRDSFGAAAMGAAVSAIMRRVKHSDPLIQLQALTLLEACVSNCGKDFQLELTKQPFHIQVKEMLTSRSCDQRTGHRLRTLLTTWAAEYRNDHQMSGFVRFVDQLVREGIIVVQGPPPPQSYASPSMYSSVSPPAQAQRQEEDDLQRAIRMSLEEAQSGQSSASTMYPTFSPQTEPTKNQPSGRKVRAIYDFEAAEDNELSFKAGEIITVLDDSDENWWKGQTQLGTGLFPANFVSTNLDATPEPVRSEKKTTTTTGTVGGATGGGAKKTVVVNETQVDLLLEMLKTADITTENEEELKTLNGLEAECKEMKPLAETNINDLQKQLDDMNEVSQKLQETFALYRRLLQEGPRLAHKAQAPPPNVEGTHPPPYQSNSQYTNEPTGSYFAPPPPDITGTYRGAYSQPAGYTHPYAPPTQGFTHPPPSLGQYTTHLAPPPQSIPVTIETVRSGGSPQLIHHQLTPPTNNSMWMTQPPSATPTAMYQQPLQPLI